MSKSKKFKPVKMEPVKAWAVVNEYDIYGNWMPDRAFTGAYAVFNDEQKATAAIQYNAALVRAEGLRRQTYRVVPVLISPLPTPRKVSKPNKKK